MPGPKFLGRVEKILKSYEVFMYLESPSGGHVEFNARPLDKTGLLECAFIGSKEMGRLAKLFGREVRVTGYDLSSDEDGSDQVLYFICDWR